MVKQQFPGGFPGRPPKAPPLPALQQDLQNAIGLHQQGKLDKAEKIYRAILRSAPGQFDAMHLLGAALFAGGRLEESERLLAQAVEINPKSAAARYNRGNVLHALKRLDDALAEYDRAIALKPDYSDAYNNRGNVLDDLGRKKEALASFDRAVALNPYNAQAHNNRGVVLNALERRDDALESFDKAIALDPNYAQAFNARGEALRGLGRKDEALEDFDRAIALDADYAEAHNNRGMLLHELKRPQDALASFDAALAAKPDYAEAYNRRGNALNELRRAAEALESFDKALALDPAYADAHNNRGIVLMELGRIDEAAEAFARAIAAAPFMAVFYRNLAHVRHLSPGDPHLLAMQEMARNEAELPDGQKPELHFALAKALDDAGEKPRAFEHLLRGNALMRKTIDYDETKTLRLMERIRDSWTPDLFQRLRGHGNKSSTPIFILGMPRSGSTLVEQILASHPEVHGGGELIVLGHAVAQVMGRRFNGDGSALTADDVSAIGALYLEEARGETGDAQRFTDKMPSNFLNMGFIHLALPNARIIHTRRDAIDTCVSCFFTQFTAGHAFSWDLGELGRYYRAYSELMQHWCALLAPQAMLEVDYESLVENPEAQARRIIDYCGLAWNPSCLAFHQSNRQVRTASLVQVREPIYRRSLQRWRDYENQLDPLFEALGPLAVAR